MTAVCFSDLGNTVVCVESNPEKLALVASGEVPFYEEGLKEKLGRYLDKERLSFTASISEMVQHSEIIFLAVGTPSLPDGSVDLSAIYQSVDDIISCLVETQERKIIVTKSTVPVGTNRAIHKKFKEAGLSPIVSVVSNPEFLREGSAVYDFFHPDRIVVGVDNGDEETMAQMGRLYDPLYRLKMPIVKTSWETAELSKYASNAFLATKISFINEIAILCEKTGADVTEVAKLMGMDGRIGAYFLHAGPGYGGACFPKDTVGLIDIAKHVGYDLQVVKAVQKVNEGQVSRIVEHLKSFFEGGLRGKKIGVLGLAFKPNTDDIRESKSISLVEKLLTLGASVVAYDPEAMVLAQQELSEVTYVEDAYQVATDVDMLILATEWNVFRELDLERLKSLMKQPYFVDLRNVYSPEVLQKNGFKGYVLGRELTL